MFVKVTKSGKHKYVSIVSAYRDKEKGIIKHKVILNLGRLDMIENNPMFQRLGMRLAELSKFKDMVDLNTVKGGNIVNVGYSVYSKLWDNYGLNELLNEMKDNTNIQFNLNTSTFLMAVEHLMNPKSKLGTYNNQSRYVNLPSVGLNHLYRSLDILSEHK
ncbi:MAG: IS1634 family transposase, partial [Caldisericum sp.]